MHDDTDIPAWWDDDDDDSICEEDIMYIKLHGGACCGIKHIHNLGSVPSFKTGARGALAGEATSFGRVVTSGVNDAHADHYPEDFFNAEAPQETYLERLERLVAFIKLHRPHGIIEIVLTLAQSVWFPLLEERGFKKVTPEGGVKNSNTSNHLNVFHLYY